MNYFYSRQQRYPQTGAVYAPPSRQSHPVLRNNGYSGNFNWSGNAGYPLPMSPPPPYDMLDTNYLSPCQPPQFYQQPTQSSQSMSATQPKTLRKKRSAWASKGNLINQDTSERRPKERRWQSTPNIPTQAEVDGLAPCPIARGMNQAAAFCDTVAERLNDVLCRLDAEDTREEEIEALVQGLTIENTRSNPESKAIERSNHDRRPGDVARGGIINFRKTWLYANSRLPPHMLPFKVYIPTWHVLCQAATASVAVYRRPKNDEKEDYIDADWRNGTKAMVLKTMPMDEKNLIVFAIRGSKWNLVDWAVNFRPAPTEPVGFLDDDGNACHAGFLQVARAMVRPVAARLKELLAQDSSRAGSSLVITGHSAGGAVATLLYMHMLSARDRVKSELKDLTGWFRRVHCVTFGVPPISLLPLQKPNDKKNEKNVFISLVNEGDPVVRADKQYLYTLGRLIAAPAPSRPVTSSGHGLRQKVSRQVLRSNETQPVRQTTRAPTWPVPDAALSNAGRLVLLRTKPNQQRSIEAVSVSDQELRGVIFGDPSMHEMAIYSQRIDQLAKSAITGRDEG